LRRVAIWRTFFFQRVHPPVPTSSSSSSSSSGIDNSGRSRDDWETYYDNSPERSLASWRIAGRSPLIRTRKEITEGWGKRNEKEGCQGRASTSLTNDDDDDDDDDDDHDDDDGDTDDGESEITARYLFLPPPPSLTLSLSLSLSLSRSRSCSLGYSEYSGLYSLQSGKWYSHRWRAEHSRVRIVQRRSY